MWSRFDDPVGFELVTNNSILSESENTMITKEDISHDDIDICQ